MSEQMDLLNFNESLSLLAELILIRPKPQKNQRETKWLKNPKATSQGNDWAFIVPSCFNDALDIKKTLRIKNKKSDEKNREKQKIWTQGSTFFFKTGDIFYNKKEAYTDWPKAISDGLYAIQVVRVNHRFQVKMEKMKEIEIGVKLPILFTIAVRMRTF